MDYGPKEAFRDYGNNSFFLTEASKDNELKRDYQEVHNGFYAAVDGLTGLFYPENESDWKFLSNLKADRRIPVAHDRKIESFSHGVTRRDSIVISLFRI